MEGSSELQSEKVKKYIKKCEARVAAVNAGTSSEEEAGYEIVQMQFDIDLDPRTHPVIEEIFDAAADLEIPRTMSYKRRVGEWDAATADSLKQEEWERLLAAIEEARRMVGG